MKYRSFGALGFDVSLLSLGCMRLPVAGGRVDRQKAVKLIRYAVDMGVNYIDTAYFYHDGESEEVVGEALLDGYREKVKLATKLPAPAVNTAGDMEKYLDIQLKRLKTDCVDFYLLHGLLNSSWEKMKGFDCMGFMERMVQKGKIRYPSFSFHDDAEAFIRIIDEYDGWKMCQIQLNFVDNEFQAGVSGMKYAAGKGMPVVIMEPLKGGRLVSRIPNEIQAVWDKNNRSPVYDSFKWLSSFPEVTTILSGMSTIEQLEENITLFDRIDSEPLSKSDMDFYEEIRNAYHERVAVSCTGCGYCMPCPYNVDIPGMLGMYNEACAYNNAEAKKFGYSIYTRAKKDASCCTNCGKCAEACPQNISIPEHMGKIREMFAFK